MAFSRRNLKERWEVISHVSDDEEDEDDEEGTSNKCDDEKENNKLQSIEEMRTCVIVQYEGSHFPGLVTKVKKKTYQVSCLVRSRIDAWKWPEKKDLCEYMPADIVEVIKAPEITNS